MNKTITVPVITGVLALSLGFYGGYSISKGNQQQTGRPDMMQKGSGNGTRSTANGNGSGNTTRDGLMKGNAPVSGKIISMDSTSITVQTTDGSNKIILISDSTKVNKSADAAKTDLKVGEEVMVIGSTSNGAVTAQSISLGAKQVEPK